MATATYTVKKGDTLSEIASKYYNSYGKTLGCSNWKAYMNKLAEINKISDVNLIYVGQKLTLSGAASSPSPSSTATTVTIQHFGLQAKSDNLLFVMWTFSRANTENYQVQWQYKAGGKWFDGSDSTTTSKQSTYSYPSNAEEVRVRVKPISTKYTKNNKQYSHYTGNWTSYKTYNVIESEPLDVPNTPSIEARRYNQKDLKGTKVPACYIEATTIDYTDERAKRMYFQLTRYSAGGNTDIVQYSNIGYGLNGFDKQTAISKFYNLDDGYEYAVRCRAAVIKNNKVTKYSEWSDYSNRVTANSKTPTVFYVEKSVETTDNVFDVYFKWDAVTGAESYVIEYTENIDYFDTGGNTTTSTELKDPDAGAVITGLTGGKTYYFRIQSKNDGGESGWSHVVPLTLGVKPAAPTTWSSVTSAVIDEEVTLYWMHNSQDESEQKYAEIELTIDNGEPETIVITTEVGKDPINYYAIDTADYTDGGSLKWRVRTAGVLTEPDGTPKYSDYSIMRTVSVYVKPTAYVNVTDQNGESLETITSFPFYANITASPSNQTPIMYHLAVTANDAYDTVDGTGNNKTIREGKNVYSVHIDPSSLDNKHEFISEFSAGNVDLENGISYTVTCTVTMDSGLVGSGSTEVVPAWNELYYEPDAEVVVDNDIYATHIRPYCGRRPWYYVVEYISADYFKTEKLIPPCDGERLDTVTTTTGEPVYEALDGTLFCIGEEMVLDDDVLLSVYRRDFDGSFTELAVDLENLGISYITDPHPALNHARYRIVAKSKTTGSVSYTDLPDIPIGGNAIVIQWNENWTDYEIDNYNESETRAWSGSMLVLPYNVDVSDSYNTDVSLVNYIGRKRPVSYYGTHLDEKSSWSTEIPSNDHVTLNLLRRLAIYTGDVYVREPSGSGYWANVKVSFNQTHCEVTIPVTFDITRVEGGV